MKNRIISQVKKLAFMLGIGAINGAVPVAALSGLFKPENAFMLAFAFIAGPGSIVTALLLDGSARERMFAALVAGIIATGIIIFAAGLGPKILGLVNINVIKIAGAISIGIIALIIAGFKINNNIPLIILGLGIIIGIIWR